MPERTRKPDRLVALDALRGIAVAGMILVVSPGDWAATYAPLQHAAWNGATAADMVFPTFLFGVGMALGLSFPRAMDAPPARRAFWTRLLRRAAALILLGLFVEATYVWSISAGATSPGEGGLGHVRIPGILQRIGLCYALAGIAIVATARRGADGLARIDPRAIGAMIAAILIGYRALLAFTPVPAYGAGGLDPAGSLPAYVDRAVFTVPHLWPLGSATGSGPATYDPEGLLSTLPATTNVLLGALAGWAWRQAPDRAALRIALAGVALICAGVLVDPFFAINKRIWTSSFALLSGGISAVTLAALIVLLRSAAIATIATPLRILGGNAILAFLLSTLMSRLAGFRLLPAGGERIDPQQWGDEHALAMIGDPRLASLACAIAVLALITLAIWPLHRRAIHFRL